MIAGLVHASSLSQTTLAASKLSFDTARDDVVRGLSDPEQAMTVTSTLETATTNEDAERTRSG
ncbi:MAG: hypothetical protein BGO98_17975 [Myxococcales bacterium 68-20]|nr:MAG: hypothetical protein BGO98_17975 [Myxococcales bacterium 68-20]